MIISYHYFVIFNYAAKFPLTNWTKQQIIYNSNKTVKQLLFKTMITLISLD